MRTAAYSDEYRNSAVYKITNIFTGDCYVGSAANYFSRKCSHLSLLRKGKHHSHRLQKAFNDIGEEGFKFEILEFTNGCDDRRWKEKDWTFTLQPYYNVYLVIKSRQKSGENALTYDI